MKTLWSKLNQWYDKQQKNADKSQPEAKPEPAKLPVVGLLFGPYNLFVDNSRKFFTIGGIFALLMTVVFLILKQNMMCPFDNNSMSGMCSRNPAAYLTARGLGLWLTAMFSVRLYQYSYGSAVFSWNWLLRPQKADFKMTAAYLLYICLNLLSMLSAYLLYIRVPNPDWRIELSYFAVVSLGFLVPFVLLRFYSLFAFIADNRKCPPLRRLWRGTAGSGLRLLSSFALLFCVMIFSLNSVSNNFRLVASENTFYITFIAEYVFNLVVLLNVMFFVNYCYLQKKFLFGKD